MVPLPQYVSARSKGCLIRDSMVIQSSFIGVIDVFYRIPGDQIACYICSEGVNNICIITVSITFANKFIGDNVITALMSCQPPIITLGIYSTRMDSFEYVNSIPNPVTKKPPSDAIFSSYIGHLCSFIDLSDSSMFHRNGMASLLLACIWGQCEC